PLEFNYPYVDFLDHTRTLSPDKFIVRGYVRENFPDQDIFKDFIEQIDIDWSLDAPEEKTSFNESMSVESMMVIRDYRRTLYGTRAENISTPEMEMIRQLLNDEGTKPELTQSVSDAITIRFKDALAHLKEEYDISFPNIAYDFESLTDTALPEEINLEECMADYDFEYYKKQCFKVMLTLSKKLIETQKSSD
ncbi:MAG: hypothetical protein HRU12_17805, partial [Phaeodactylibacter sp.]|nr:hypothetical protein [Phaeodactylibacter sp.]